MLPNKRVTDALIRYRLALIGYGKYVADQVIKFINATEPRIRRELLDVFGTTTDRTRLITRLRDAESRLLRVRRSGWSRAAHEAIAILTKVALFTPSVLSQNVYQKLNEPTEGSLTRRVKTALVAGRTLPEWFDSMQQSDLTRMVGQLRVGVLAGESTDRIINRVVGRTSPVASAAKRGMSAIMESALGSLAVGIFGMMAKGNRQVFDKEIWVSVLDARTTDGCRALNGQIFDIGFGPQPGYHIFCRSMRVPLDPEGGDYSPNNYSDWIDDQDEDFTSYAGDDFDVKSLKALDFDQLKDLV